MTDEMQSNQTEGMKPPGNLLTVIPGVIICILTTGLVFLLAIGSNLLLPQEERDSIQEALHLKEITSIFEEWEPE